MIYNHSIWYHPGDGSSQGFFLTTITTGCSLEINSLYQYISVQNTDLTFFLTESMREAVIWSGHMLYLSSPGCWQCEYVNKKKVKPRLGFINVWCEMSDYEVSGSIVKPGYVFWERCEAWDKMTEDSVYTLFQE